MLIFSIPPATTISASPHIIACAPNITDFIPEAHTLFIVVQATSLDKPAKIAACLAGACPTPACTTLPIYTSFTKAGSRFILFNAPLMAIAPNCGAGTLDNAPIKLPIGVRTADTITTFFIFEIFLNYSCEFTNFIKILSFLIAFF